MKVIKNITENFPIFIKSSRLLIENKLIKSGIEQEIKLQLQYLIQMQTKRQLNYQFDLQIQRVHLLINMKCDVQIWWKSGKRKIVTKNSIKLSGEQKYFDVHQKLSTIAKIIMENGILKQRKTQLIIILFISDNTSKLGGRVYLNLAQFISIDNLLVPFSRKFQRSLQNCPDNASKIIFNLSWKYVEDNFCGDTGENLHDISFQASNFSNSFSVNFGLKSTNDMTFRPEKERQEQNYRKTQQNWGAMPMSKLQYSSKQKRNEKDWDKQKMDTPNWEKNQRQKQQQQYNSNAMSGRNKERQLDRYPPPNNTQNQQRPMEFSFNPLTQADRERLGLDNSEIIRQLKQIVEQKGQKIKYLQQQNAKLRSQFEQRNEKSSSKSLSLLNQLNSTASQKQQLQRQKNELLVHIEQIKQQNRKLQQKYKSLNYQYQQSNNESLNKFEQRKKLIDQLTIKLQEADKKILKYKDQLYKKQNQLINKQKQCQVFLNNQQLINKQHNQKFKNVSISLKQLQTNFQKVFQEKQNFKKKFQDQLYKCQKSQQNAQKISQNVSRLDQQLQKQRQKTKTLQLKYKQRQSMILQIQNQLKLFQNQKIQVIKQKDQQISILRDKFNGACKKLDDISNGQQSMRNMVSQKNIRIKTLQGICQQLQKSLQQKQQLISKAKQYVQSKQQQLQYKNNQITKRDEFIQKCRVYMQNKQKQYNQIIGQKSNSSSQLIFLKNQLKKKQKIFQDYINEKYQLQKDNQNITKVIDRLKGRVMECQDTIDQLHRKNQSQECTLKELVATNLNLQIQLKVKDYEIQSLRVIK